MTNHLTALESILAICNETREARDLQPRLTEIRSIAREALTKADATTSAESREPTDEQAKALILDVCGEMASYDFRDVLYCVRAALAARPVAQADAGAPKAKAIAEFNNGSWRLRLGSVWMTAPNPSVGPDMVSEEYKAKMYAARINAEINGGVAAFGCDKEARGMTYSNGDKIPRCSNWCGLERCAVSLKSALAASAQATQATNQPGPSGDRPSDFQEGQWWLQKLDEVASAGTDDFKRAVAVVRNMMRTMHAQATQATQAVEPVAAEEDKKRLDYLDAAANEMLLEFGFEIDGGVYLRIDAPGHGGTDIREKNSARAAIDSAMVVAPC